MDEKYFHGFLKRKKNTEDQDENQKGRNEEEKRKKRFRYSIPPNQPDFVLLQRGKFNRQLPTVDCLMLFTRNVLGPCFQERDTLLPIYLAPMYYHSSAV